ncbi:MAG: VWA domain-containing protein [Acidobacteria bacterium]|nr:VWA domain-containing protein [Acidobacteriota bacterium]
MRTMRAAVTVSALLLGTAVPTALLAQDPAGKRVASSAEVLAGEVAAIVLGPDGKPAVGLRKEDFQLFLGGVEVPIDFVSGGPDGRDALVAAADAPVTERGVVPPRSIVFVIDDQHIASGDRSRALEMALAILRAKRDAEPVAIYRNYRGTRLVMPFTPEAERVESALQKLFAQSPEAVPLPGLESEPYRATGAQDATVLPTGSNSTAARTGRVLAATEADVETRDFLRSLGFVMLSLAGRPEPKTMVVLAAPTGWPKRLTELSTVVEQAVLARVSVVAVDPSAGVTASTLVSQRAPTDAQGSLDDLHIVLANDTGGERFRGTLAEPLLRQIDDLRVAYRIAFTPKDASTANRAVRIVVRRPGYSVRSPKAHRTQTDAVRADSKFASALLESPVPAGDFPIKLLPPRDAKAPAGKNLISMEIAIPYGALTFLPKGDRRVADVEVMVVAIDDKGATSEVNRETFDVKVPEDKWEQASKTFFWRPLSVKTKGSGRVLVGVRDVLTSRIGQAFIDYGN